MKYKTKRQFDRINKIDRIEKYALKKDILLPACVLCVLVVQFLVIL